MTQTLVNAVDGSRSVAKKRFRFRFVDIAASHPSGDRNTRAVKTYALLFQTQSVEDMRPDPRWIKLAVTEVGILLVVGVGAAVGAELQKERHQIGMDPNAPNFSAFGVDHHGLIVEVNLRQGKTGFANTAAVMDGDFKRHVKKMALVEIRPGFDRGADGGDVLVGQLWFLAGGLAFDAERANGVMWNPTADQSFLQENRQGFKFDQGRVMARGIFSGGRVGLFPPGNIADADPASNGGRAGEVGLVHEHQEIPPAGFMTVQRVRIDEVFAFEKSGHPCPPGAVRDRCSPGFSQGFLGAQFTRGTGIAPDADAQAGGLPLDLRAFPKLNPPERGLGLFIKTGHLVCPSMPKLPKTVKRNRRLSKQTERNRGWWSKRRFDSDPRLQLIIKDLCKRYAQSMPLGAGRRRFSSLFFPFRGRCLTRKRGDLYPIRAELWLDALDGLNRGAYGG